jgi:hypothetical protein
MKECWRPAVGFEGLYEISDQGQVRGLRRGRILAQFPDEQGYLRVWLSRNGQASVHRVHRLVGEAFLGPRPTGMQTRHGPGGIRDNRVINLCYGTAIENAEDKDRDGVQIRGSNVGTAKLTDSVVLDCRTRRAAGATWRSLAEEFGVSRRTMFFAVSGRTWGHVHG